MAALATPSSSAMALRAAFGDRKPPDISRKITACVACRKLKIKCQMPDAGPPCDRCKKRDLSCTVNRSLQQVLESDLSWKDTIEERLALLESSVSRLTGEDHTTGAALLHVDNDDSGLLSTNTEPQSTQNGPNNDEQQSWEVIVDTNGAPAAVPASVVSEISSIKAPQKIRSSSHKHSDLISRGILNIQAAVALFDVYYKRLDHFLYSILGDHRSLEDVRKASPTLTNSICAVAALHTGGENYAACRSAFIQQVLTQVFSKKHTADDIRGLVIGAFWLSDMSWALIGLAVRIANEINLNRSFVRPKYSSREWYLNARLYLLVHVCDRHFSIVYGRAPMSETFHNLGFGHEFLKSEHACEDDARLFSQVEIWSISYRIYRTFGVDTEAPLPKTSLSDFRRIGIALDTWRADWEDKFAVNQHVGSYPRKGVSLHFDFAKLYLYSHAYRGVLNIQATAQSPIWGLDEFAMHAVSSAEAIVRAIVTDPEIQGHVNGLPTYFHTMIAFAVVFLLKVVSNAPASMRVDKNEIMSILGQMSEVLQQIASTMRKEHIMCSIARSIKKLIEKATIAVSLDPHQSQQQHISAPSQPLAGNDFGWLMSPDNSLFVGNFDLTQPGQELDFNFMDFGPMS